MFRAIVWRMSFSNSPGSASPARTTTGAQSQSDRCDGLEASAAGVSKQILSREAVTKQRSHLKASQSQDQGPASLPAPMLAQAPEIAQEVTGVKQDAVSRPVVAEGRRERLGRDLVRRRMALRDGCHVQGERGPGSGGTLSAVLGSARGVYAVPGGRCD